MNKADLIEAVAARIDSSKKDAAEAVEAVVEAIQEAVAKGQKVSISGFGVFEQAARAERTYRRPSTGEAIKKVATSVPRFRPGGDFKKFVAGEKQFVEGAVRAARDAGEDAVRAALDVGEAAAARAESMAETVVEQVVGNERVKSALQAVGLPVWGDEASAEVPADQAASGTVPIREPEPTTEEPSGTAVAQVEPPPEIPVALAEPAPVLDVEQLAPVPADAPGARASSERTAKVGRSIRKLRTEPEPEADEEAPIRLPRRIRVAKAARLAAEAAEAADEAESPAEPADAEPSVDGANVEMGG
ncbi:MAG: HU family DNA-binding protein [Candidatus Nanopelagicales bacterium]